MIVLMEEKRKLLRSVEEDKTVGKGDDRWGGVGGSAGSCGMHKVFYFF